MDLIGVYEEGSKETVTVLRDFIDSARKKLWMQATE